MSLESVYMKSQIAVAVRLRVMDRSPPGTPSRRRGRKVAAACRGSGSHGDPASTCQLSLHRGAYLGVITTTINDCNEAALAGACPAPAIGPHFNAVLVSVFLAFWLFVLSQPDDVLET